MAPRERDRRPRQSRPLCMRAPIVERMRYPGGGPVVRELPIFQVVGGASGHGTYLLAGRSAVCVSHEGHSSSGSVNTIAFGLARGALVVGNSTRSRDRRDGRLHSDFGRATSTLASNSATSSSSANSEASSSLAASSSSLFSSPAPAQRSTLSNERLRPWRCATGPYGREERLPRLLGFLGSEPNVHPGIRPTRLCALGRSDRRAACATYTMLSAIGSVLAAPVDHPLVSCVTLRSGGGDRQGASTADATGRSATLRTQRVHPTGWKVRTQRPCVGLYA